MSRLIDLYPRPWRERYEDEFRGLISERPPTVGDRLDIMRGALGERLHPQVPGPVRIRDRSGLGPLVGFGLLVGAAIVAANGPIQSDEYGTYRDGGAALPLFFVAAILLSIGLYRVVESLPIQAQLARVGGWTAIVAGSTWSIMPWVAPLGLTFLLGILGLAVGVRRAGIWPAWSEVVLVVVLAVPAGLFAAMPFLPWYAFRVSGLDFSVVMGPMSLAWLVVGGLVLRGQPQAPRAGVGANS